MEGSCSGHRQLGQMAKRFERGQDPSFAFFCPEEERDGPRVFDSLEWSMNVEP